VGFQCACLSTDGSTLYVLLPSGILVLLDTAKDIVVNQIPVLVLNMVDCFEETSTASLIFVDNGQAASSVELQRMDLITHTIQSSYQTGEMFYSSSAGSSLISLAFGTIVSVYYKDLGICPDGEYYESQKQACIACPRGCSSCLSYTDCTACETNFTMANGTCNPNKTVNATAIASISMINGTIIGINMTNALNSTVTNATNVTAGTSTPTNTTNTSAVSNTTNTTSAN